MINAPKPLRRRTPFLLCCCLVTALLASGGSPANAEVTIDNVRSGDPLIGNPLVLTVNGMPQALAEKKLKAENLTLTLDGRAIAGLKGVLLDEKNLEFRPERTADTKRVWNELLGSPRFGNPTRKMKVGLVAPDGQPFAPPHEGVFRIYSATWANICFIFIIGVLVAFFFLAKETNIIRDANPPNPKRDTPIPRKKDQRPYSLGRTQAAFWFFLVIASFLFIYLITNDYNTITSQALVLIGIGTGTALGGAMIDASKRNTSNDELGTLLPEKARLQAEVGELDRRQQELEKKISDAGAAATDADKIALGESKVSLSQKKEILAATEKKIEEAESGLTKPVSEGFFRDLLTDADGITFHRFQILVWTIILGALFLVGVYRALGMPEFDGTLLALMGISAGTYLGFKIPERQS
jgi:hypothetical protein